MAGGGVDGSERLEINSPGVVAEIVDGEVVAINLESGCYYSIQGSGAIVWSFLAAGWSAAETVVELRSRFDSDPESLEGEISRFGSDLLSESLLRSRTRDGASVVPDEMIPRERVAPSPLVLEKFTDMEDLLLLDPIHDVDAQGWPHVDPAAEL